MKSNVLPLLTEAAGGFAASEAPAAPDFPLLENNFLNMGDPNLDPASLGVTLASCANPHPCPRFGTA